MKLTKLVMGAAVIAATLGLASCGDPANAITGNKVDMDNSYVKVITKDGKETVKAAKKSDFETYTAKTDAEKAKLDYVVKANNSYYYRAFGNLATKHYDSIAQITVKKNEFKQEGVAGFIFDLKTNDDDTMSFIAVSIRENDEKADSYVSYFDKVVLSDDSFTTLSNFGDKNGVKIGDTGCLAAETVILKGTGTDPFYHFAETEYKLDEDNEFTVVIAVTAEDDGSYKVKYFKTDDLTLTGKIKDGATAVKTVTVAASVSGLTEKTKTNMARYANIYPSKHFTAKFKFTDMNGNEIPMEFED